jgi:chaperonin GroES
VHGRLTIEKPLDSVDACPYRWQSEGQSANGTHLWWNCQTGSSAPIFEASVRNLRSLPLKTHLNPSGALISARLKGKQMITKLVTTTFTPLHDRILVRRVEEGETVRGGIIIPDSAKEKPQEGEVISVGKGKSNDEGKVFPLDVKAGDRVLFGKYSGTEIKVDNEEFLIMREEEVLGIVKK